jgi:subtilisin family serine protease
MMTNYFSPGQKPHRVNVMRWLAVALALFGVWHEPAAAMSQAPVELLMSLGQTAQRSDAEDFDLYIVQLHDPPLPIHVAHLQAQAAAADQMTEMRKLDMESDVSRAYLDYLDASHQATLSAIETRLQRKVEPVFRYRLAFNGFAIRLSADEAASLQGIPEIARVQRDDESQFQTDFGPAQMGAPALWDGSALAGVETRGEGVVIGVIDSGINYQHPSFADVGADGYNHVNPRGRFYGVCDPATGAPYCNYKLIGVYDFTNTTGGLDDNGHGSHIAAIAAGNFVDARYPAPNGPLRRMSGVAPHANLIVYKTSVNNSSAHTRVLAAYEQAIADGVDVLNYSISGQAISFWRHAIAQAQLSAHAAGIVVAAAAGNAGPFSSAHMNAMPWVMAVGATTHQRTMPNRLTNLSGGVAPPLDLQGAGQAPAYGPAPIAHAANVGDPYCSQPFAAGVWAQGTIVVCDRGVVPLENKAANIKAGGAAYFVLANTQEWGEATLAFQPDFALPMVHLGYAASQSLREWLASGGNHRAAITAPTETLDPAFADRVAWFSSRGPNPLHPGVLKPDLTAPGASILAANFAATPQSTNVYTIKSGASMATPHAAGAAALLIALHSDWSPAAIQSVLMSTARHSLLLEDGRTRSTPFDEGAGRIDLPSAVRAGLFLDEQVGVFQAADPDFGGQPRTLNLASLADGQCTPRCEWTRTLTSAVQVTVTWRISATASPALTVTVTPTSFTLPPGAAQVITVAASLESVSDSAWRFGMVTMTPAASEIANAHLPLAVRRLHTVYLPTVAGGSGAGWVTIVREDFETDFPSPGWEQQEQGWMRRNCLPYRGAYSGWAVGEGDNGGAMPCGAHYPNNASSALVYGPFSLADADDAVIELAYWTNTEAVNDWLFWGVSTDQVNFYGRRNWGDSGGWKTAVFDLTDVFTLGDLRGEPRVWFMLRFWSNRTLNFPGGAYVDDIVIRKYVAPSVLAQRKAGGQGECDEQTETSLAQRSACAQSIWQTR